MSENQTATHPTHPACELCRGACCETVLFPKAASNPDIDQWLGLRAIATTHNGNHLCQCRCTKLRHGRCTIYDERPNLCSEYMVGGDACRATVKAVRPEIAAEIEERF